MRIVFLLTMTLLVQVSEVFAQCSTCIIDSTCVSPDGFPSMCPDVLPNATAGVAYEQFLTFYMPSVITDPSSGLTVTLTAVEVLSVTGLPFGMSITVNDADGIFYPSAGDQFGCATLCGVPLLPGVYDIAVSVLGTVNYNGLEFQQAQSFTYTIIVDPGAGGTNSFSYSNSADCGTLDVTLSALITAPAPSVTEYAWQFEDGSTSASSDTSLVFTVPGDHQVILTTTISDYVLTSVDLQGLQGGWGSDEDFLGSPDPYFVLNDANGNPVYSSSIIDNVSTNTWSGLNIQLATPPYTISFFDDDPISADDALGTVDVLLQAGDQNFDNGSGTNGAFSVLLDLTSQVQDTAVFTVFPSPTIMIELANAVFTATAAGATSYQWYYNGTAIDGANGPTVSASSSGQYSCSVINEYGCSIWSEPVLYCQPITPSYDVPSLELSVPNLYTSYQWYYNGVAVQGATLYYMIAPPPGIYAVALTDAQGCDFMSNNFTVVEIGVGETQQAVASIYPNPTSGSLTLSANSAPIVGYEIYNGLGQLVMRDYSRQSSLIELDLSDLTSGVYLVRVATSLGHSDQRIVKQ